MLAAPERLPFFLELMLEEFCQFFPARPAEEERYIIATFSHAQSDAIMTHIVLAHVTLLAPVVLPVCETSIWL